MEAAASARAPGARGQAGLLVLLLGLAIVAWVATEERMGGMDSGPGTDPGSLGFYATTWVVMMAAMMFPSISPMVLTYRRVQAGRRRLGRPVPAGATAVFVAGYLIAWTLFGLAAYAVVDGVRSLSIDFLAWDRAGREIAAGVLAAAAVYQLTPAKDACLTRCRAPLDFLMERWRDGGVGALRLGALHGMWCVGCCWGLMAALFALGAMSLGWMAFVAAAIAAEKLLPYRAAATGAVAALLLALAIGIAVAPDRVPGLTVPGSGMEMHDPGMNSTMPSGH